MPNDKTVTTNEEELRHHLALTLRVLFPNEAWDTYIRSAVCIIHEVRNHPRKEKANAEEDPDIPDNELVRDGGQFGMGA